MEIKSTTTRFAPSPTGFLHIGVLRTALYNYLFAKHNKGKFLLRIEDTDQARKVEGAEEDILETLKWAGLETDGEVVRQSERLDLYKKHIENLLDKGQAYYCFCSPERLTKMREEQVAMKQAPMYDGECREIDPKEAEKRAEYEPHVIRLKVPKEGVTEYEDLIRGKVSFENKLVDDQVLLKSDGFPTYHLANVVDDHLQGVTHVLRGEEWLSSTPKHILLYQAFSWKLPDFGHLPQLLNKNKKKLSKRDGAAGVQDFIKQGYLKDALINFIAFLGWNPGDEREIFSLEELVKEFDLKRVHKAGAVFDLDRLNYLNGLYIRRLSVLELAKLCAPYLPAPAGADGQAGLPKSDVKYIEQVIALEQDRLKTLAEVGERTKYFFSDDLDYESELLIWKNLPEAKIKNNLELILEVLENLKTWNRTELEKNLMNLIKEKNLTNGEVLWPLRVALTGEKASPGPFEVAEVLGRERAVERVRKAIDKLCDS